MQKFNRRDFLKMAATSLLVFIPGGQQDKTDDNDFIDFTPPLSNNIEIRFNGIKLRKLKYWSVCALVSAPSLPDVVGYGYLEIAMTDTQGHFVFSGNDLLTRRVPGWTSWSTT